MEELSEADQRELMESRDTSRMVYPPISQNPNGRQRAKSEVYYNYPIYDPRGASALMNLSLSICNPTREQINNERTIVEAPPPPEPAVLSTPVVSQKMFCTFCKVAFSSQREQRQHYKTDWHTYNVKHETSLTEDEFETYIMNASEVSSISGSDSTTEGSEVEGDTGGRCRRCQASALPPHLLRRSATTSSSPTHSPSSPASHSPARSTDSEGEGGGGQGRRHPKVYFRNGQGDVISIYRVLLHSKKRPLETPEELIRRAEALPNLKTWAVILLNAGHFAATIFNRGEEIIHKTFHRYVIRAKRGSAQSSRDSQGNAPRSAGANLRRHNEQALAQDIQKLLASWSEHLKACEFIFLRTGNNRGVFFGGKNAIFRKDDDRIRNIPFPCRRSTYNEANRVSQMLTAVECYGKEVSMGNMVPISPMRCYNACTQRLEIASPDNSPQHSPQRLLRKRLSESSSLAAVGREGMEGQCRERVSRSQEEAGAVPCPKPGTQRRQHQSPPDMSTYPGCALTSDSSSDKEMAAEVTSKASRKRKGKKQQRGSALRHQMAPEDVLFEERYHFRNQMYTACKTGNINDVRNLLAIISGVTETPTPTNPPALGDPTSSSLSSAELPTPTNSLFKDLPSSSHVFSMEPPTPCNSSTDFSTSYYPPSSSQYPLSSQAPSILVTLDEGAGSSDEPPRECDSSETLKGDLASLSNTSNSTEGTSPSNVASTCSCSGTTTNEAVTPAGQVAEDVSLRATAAGQGGVDDQGSSSKGDAVQSPAAAQLSGQASAGSLSMHQGSRVPDKDDLTVRLTKLSCSQNGPMSAGGKGSKCSEGSIGVSDSSPSVPLSQPSTSSSTATNWSLPLVSQQSRGLMMSPLSPISACDILNETFGDNGTSMLHVAAKEGHKAVVRALMLAGADPAVRDKHGRTPYTFATDKETKKEFRRFMAAFPDRYNYSKAQIPSPLTAEMEQEKRQKEAERKKEKKKAQKERMQAKKAEQLKAQKEEEERNKFLALSDREKRALAAERRLQQQLSGPSTEQASKPVLRCWKCGADISGKVPFTYSDFKFCSIKCLQQHRADNQKS